MKQPMHSTTILRAALVGLLAMAVLDTPLSGQTPDEAMVREVVGRAAEAWGGAQRVAEMENLSVRVVYSGHDYPVTVDFTRPGKVRVTGGDRYVSVFDGTAAAFLKNHDRDGNPLAPSAVPAAEVKDWELEAAWLFPAFFDHPATYQGRQLVEGDPVHVLRVPLPLGAQVDYFVDAKTYLVRKAEATTVIDGTTYTMGRVYHDFRRTSGVLYAAAMDCTFEDNVEPATIEALDTDVSFPTEHFRIPAALLPERGDTGGHASPDAPVTDLQTRAARVLARAAEAHGGWDRLRAIHSVTFDADMERGYLGQNPTPDDETVRLAPSRFRVTWDYQRGGLVAEMYRPANAPQPVARVVLRPDDAFMAVPSQGLVQAVPPMDEPPWSWFLRDATFAPALLLEAADAAETLRPVTGVDDAGRPTEGVSYVDADGILQTLWFSADTGLLERKVSVVDHPQWGRTTESATFGEYADTDGLLAPGSVTITVGAEVLSRSEVGPPDVNRDDVAPLFQRPEGAREVPGQIPTGPGAEQRTEEVVPGVVQVLNVIPGYNLTYVEFEDGIVLLEALGGGDQVEEVLRRLEAASPAKPITAAVVTHHHFDHTDGLVPVLARKIPVYAPAGMDGFLQGLAQAPRTDPRVGTPLPLELRVVTDSLTIGSGPNRFTLFEVGPNPHSRTLLVAYFPEHRLMYVPDVYGYLPGYTPPPLLLSFADKLEALGLTVDRFATAHTEPTTFAEYQAMVAAVRAQSRGGAPGS